MLLFLDREVDLHADWVEAECDRRGVPYVRLCTQKFPQEIQLALNLDDGHLGGRIQLPDREIRIEDITGVWYRRPEPAKPDPDLEPEFAQFVKLESDETLYGLYRALWDRRWVNTPHIDRAADNKISQLRRARRIGFKTPKTIVTNDPHEALAFFHACGHEMVYKLMRPVFAEDIDGASYGVYTTLIAGEDIDTHLDSVRIAPCLFQELVPKQYELRINVIGDYVWAAAIYSQDAERTKLDHRYDTINCRHEPVLIPTKLEKMCLEMTHQLGLVMCNLDMIFTPEQEYVFLEVNPNGQWAWVEDRVGFPLTMALVNELLGVDTLSDHPYIKHRSLDFEPNTAIKGLA